MDTGETLRLEDLQKGMGLVSPARQGQDRHGVREEDPDESLMEGDISEIPLPNDGDEMEESSVLMEAPQLSGSLGSMGSSKRKRDVLEPPASFDLRPPGTVQRSPAKCCTTSNTRSSQRTEQQSEEHHEGGQESREQPSEVQMTLNEKLDAVAREAADAKQGGMQQVDGADDADELQDDDTLGQIVSPVRKTKIRGRAKRRKSTLSREELAELLLEGGEQ